MSPRRLIGRPLLLMLLPLVGVPVHLGRGVPLRWGVTFTVQDRGVTGGTHAVHGHWRLHYYALPGEQGNKKRQAQDHANTEKLGWKHEG